MMVCAKLYIPLIFSFVVWVDSFAVWSTRERKIKWISWICVCVCVYVLVLYRGEHKCVTFTLNCFSLLHSWLVTHQFKNERELWFVYACDLYGRWKSHSKGLFFSLRSFPDWRSEGALCFTNVVEKVVVVFMTLRTLQFAWCRFKFN